MRIAIKATHIAPGGGLTHFNKITEWFGRLAPDYRFIVLGKQGQQELFKAVPNNFEYHYFRTPSVNLPARIAWEKLQLPGIIRMLEPDLLFEPGNYGATQVACPKVCLIHNIAPFSREYIKEERLLQRIRLCLLRWATIANMRSSQGVIFLSEYCRDFFAEHVDHYKAQTAVIYHGKPDAASTGSPNPREVLDDLDIKGEYLLSVSHIYRYKKIREMVQSYLLASDAGRHLPPLYIAGAPYDQDYVSEIRDLVSRSASKGRVVFLGTVAEDKLQVLYKNSAAFLFPSVLETCSAILIEAMANGCAVACSNKSVMPEVTGNGALYFDPDNIHEFAEKIRLVVEDKKLNDQLRAHSLRRAEFFSWEKSARQMLEFFNEVSGVRQDWDRQEEIPVEAGEVRTAGFPSSIPAGGNPAKDKHNGS